MQQIFKDSKQKLLKQLLLVFDHVNEVIENYDEKENNRRDIRKNIQFT